MHETHELLCALDALPIELEHDVANFEPTLGCGPVVINPSDFDAALLAQVQRLGMISVDLSDADSEEAPSRNVRDDCGPLWLWRRRRRMVGSRKETSC